MAFPTMYEHDCISNIAAVEPQLLSRQGAVFMPLLDYLLMLAEDLTPAEREQLVARILATSWLQGGGEHGD